MFTLLAGLLWITTPLKFQEALDLADASPVVQAAHRVADQRRVEGDDLSRLTANPLLQVQPGGRRMSAGGTGAELYLGLSQRLNLGGFGKKRKASVAREAEQDMALANVTRQRVRLSVAVAWLARWSAQAAIEIAANEQRLAEELEQRLERTLAAGEATRVDLAMATAWRAESVLGTLSAEGEAFESGVLLARALGVASATLRLQAAELRRGRLAPLVEQALARASELAELDATIATTRAEAQTARATLRAAGVTDQKARGLLVGDGSISLRSPLAGMVTAVSAQPGQVRSPVDGQLVEIAAASAVQIEARLMVTPPDGVQFEWLSTMGKVPLTLRAISPRANTQDGSKLAWFEVAPGSASPPAGSVGRVRTIPQPGWVMVPTRAITFDDGNPSVIVLDPERTTQVRASVLMQNGSEAIIVGIKAGTRIAADAALARGTRT